MGDGAPLVELRELTRRLRAECPWDREQTARTIVPHTVEEAYEVADAALADDPVKLRDELGDLLFQVFFLSLLLEEQGEGDLDDVTRAVHEKLVRRHPHVFGDAEARTAGRVRERWEEIKTEREGRIGVFHDVPESLPALLLARKAQRRAAAVGYDWPDLDGPSEKVREELDELLAELARAGRPAPETEPDRAVEAELGDLLFTVVNLARFVNVDPELALRGATGRFRRRVELAERLAAEAGETWTELGLEEQERWYERAKATMGSRGRGSLASSEFSVPESCAASDRLRRGRAPPGPRRSAGPPGRDPGVPSAEQATPPRLPCGVRSGGPRRRGSRGRLARPKRSATQPGRAR